MWEDRASDWGKCPSRAATGGHLCKSLLYHFVNILSSSKGKHFISGENTRKYMKIKKHNGRTRLKSKNTQQNGQITRRKK